MVDIGVAVLLVGVGIFFVVFPQFMVSESEFWNKQELPPWQVRFNKFFGYFLLGVGLLMVILLLAGVSVFE